jgi:hypothetical protein
MTECEAAAAHASTLAQVFLLVVYGESQEAMNQMGDAMCRILQFGVAWRR